MKVYVSHFLEVLGYVNINTSRIVLKIARLTPAMYLRLLLSKPQHYPIPNLVKN